MTHDRERHRSDGFPAGPPGGAGEGGGERLRAAADHFLRQADRAIDRALSDDSEAFLNANRQEVGQ
jgi:hypothetical protein